MTPTVTDIFASVRNELLGEAQSSPGLLADLANLERYIAATYSARSFIELLQNADDAKAKRFLLTRHGEWLVCANDGQAFTRQDFYSLCRTPPQQNNVARLSAIAASASNRSLASPAACI